MKYQMMCFGGLTAVMVALGSGAINQGSLELRTGGYRVLEGPLHRQAELQTDRPEATHSSNDSGLKRVWYSGSNKRSQSSSVVIDTTVDDVANDEYRLKIQGSSGARLSGRIVLNGQTIKQLDRLPLDLDLESYLQPGLNTIEVSGTYQPVTASVTLELEGPNTSLVQTTSGSGRLNQTFQFDTE